MFESFRELMTGINDALRTMMQRGVLRSLDDASVTFIQRALGSGAALFRINWEPTPRQARFILYTSVAFAILGFGLGLIPGAILPVTMLAGLVLGFTLGLAIVAASERFPIFNRLIDWVVGPEENQEVELQAVQDQQRVYYSVPQDGFDPEDAVHAGVVNGHKAPSEEGMHLHYPHPFSMPLPVLPPGNAPKPTEETSPLLSGHS